MTAIISLMSFLLFLVGMVVPFAAAAYFFFCCGQGSGWTFVVGYGLVAFILNPYLFEKATLLVQAISHSAFLSLMVSLAVHAGMLCGMVYWVPEQDWWVMVLVIWELVRHSQQKVLTLTMRSEPELLPILYIQDPTLMSRAGLTAAAYIIISGIGSMIAAVILWQR